jgi:hypothetical protein
MASPLPEHATDDSGNIAVLQYRDGWILGTTMTALTLLIIRHAEKPGEAWPGPGLTEDGVADDKSLVIRGWQRAGAWAALFGADLDGDDYPKPKAIYAAAPGAGGDDNAGPSKRPCETVLPLSARVPLTTSTKFALGDEDKLWKEVSGLSGVVLVAWEHKAIVEKLVPLIPVKGDAPPAHWPGDRFDMVLRFDRADGETKFAYRPLCPCLMSGDPKTPF